MSPGLGEGFPSPLVGLLFLGAFFLGEGLGAFGFGSLFGEGGGEFGVSGTGGDGFDDGFAKVGVEFAFEAEAFVLVQTEGGEIEFAVLGEVGEEGEFAGFDDG